MTLGVERCARYKSNVRAMLTFSEWLFDHESIDQTLVIVLLNLRAHNGELAGR